MKPTRTFFALLLAGILLGCTPTETTSTGVEATGKADQPVATGEAPKTNEEPPAKPATESIPASLKTPGYEYFGLENFNELTYTQSSESQGTQEGTQTTTFKEMKDGKAMFSVARTGAFSAIGDSEISVTPTGVYTVSVGGKALDAPSMEVPADLGPGKSWSSKSTFTIDINATPTKVSQNMSFRAEKVEKVKTKAGEFEALKITGSGSLTTGAETSPNKTTMWLAKGVGIVKMDSVLTQKGKPLKLVMELVKK